VVLPVLCTVEIFTINTSDLLDSISAKMSLGSYAAILAGRMEEFHVSTSKSTLWALLFVVPCMMVEQFLNQSSRLLYSSNLTLSFIAISVNIYSFKIIPLIWVFSECSFLLPHLHCLVWYRNVYSFTQLYDLFDIMAFIVKGDGAQYFCSGHRR